MEGEGLVDAKEIDYVYTAGKDFANKMLNVA